eukprot:scaffold309042_cov23-Tisochrysis_lutea.AAC.1
MCLSQPVSPGLAPGAAGAHTSSRQPSAAYLLIWSAYRVFRVLIASLRRAGTRSSRCTSSSPPMAAADDASLPQWAPLTQRKQRRGYCRCGRDCSVWDARYPSVCSVQSACCNAVHWCLGRCRLSSSSMRACTGSLADRACYLCELAVQAAACGWLVAMLCASALNTADKAQHRQRSSSL